MMRLVRTMRASIIEGTFHAYINTFLQTQFPDGNYPQWVRDALQDAGVVIDDFKGCEKGGTGGAEECSAVGGGDAGEGGGDGEERKEERREERKEERREEGRDEALDDSDNGPLAKRPKY